MCSQLNVENPFPYLEINFFYLCIRNCFSNTSQFKALCWASGDTKGESNIDTIHQELTGRWG